MPQAIAYVVAVVYNALVYVGFTAATATILATAIVNIAISAAIAAASAALAPSSDPGERLLNAAQWSSLTADPLSDRVIIYGETGIAGEVVFQQVTEDRESVNFVIALAESGQPEGHEWTGTLIDGDPVEFDGEGIETGDYGDALQVRFYGGTPDQTADTALLFESGGVWNEVHRGAGVCYAIMRQEVSNDTKFPSGRVNPIFKIKGRRLYDPRLDSTKPGSSGSHRIDDQSTWEWSDNAALCAYDYARGIVVDGESGGVGPRRVAGLGLPDDLIDESWVVASANVCDEMGWTINGPLNAGSDPADVLRSFAIHMGGRIATRKGRLAIIAGYDWPSTLEIVENDLAGQVKLKGARKWRETHNAIKAAYRDGSEEGKFGPTETNLVKVQDWIDQDNGETFERPISLPFTTDRAQATRLAKLDLFKRRAPRTIEVPVKLAKSRAIEGDYVDVNLPSYGINETYEVIGWVLDQAGFASMTLQVWNPDGLEWAYGEEGNPPSFSQLNRLSLVPDDPAAEDWSSFAQSESSGSGELPAILIAGVSPSWIDAVIFEWRALTESGWNLWGEGPPGLNSAKITGLAPGKDYQVAVSYRFGNRVSGRLIEDVISPTDLIASAAATSEIADAIVGQGDLATTNQAALPFGENGLINSDFVSPGTFPPTGWENGGNNTGLTVNRSVITSGARVALAAAVVGTAANGTIFDPVRVKGLSGAVPADLRRFAIPVVAGDVIAASALLAHNGSVSSGHMRIAWRNAAGANVSESAGSNVVNNQDGSGGEPDNFALASIVATAPANARYACPFVRFTCNGGASATGWAMSYMGAVVPGGQAAVPPYAPSPPDRRADLTVDNVASAITGQGAGATANDLADLDAPANTIVTNVNIGTHIPAQADGVIGHATAADAAWVEVAEIDIAIPTRRYVYFPEVELEFEAAGSASTAGIRIVESGGAVLFSDTKLVGAALGATWNAPIAWGTQATAASGWGATKTFVLQINRTGGLGTIEVLGGNGVFAGGVF